MTSASGPSQGPLRRAAVRTVASWAIASSPAAALETSAALEAFGPSLMPRAALHQGMATGLSVLAARGVGAVAEVGIGVLSGGSSSLRPRLAAAAVIAAAGGGLALPHRPGADGEPLAVAAARSGGWLLAVGAASSAAYDTAMAARDRLPGPVQGRCGACSAGRRWRWSRGGGCACASGWSRSGRRPINRPGWRVPG